MDKIAANNYFVSLQKEVKKAKAMVSGNLIRKISKLEEEKAKAKDDDSTNKIKAKIEHIVNDIKLLKTLDLYQIAKQATLQPDRNVWQKMIGDSKAAASDILTARVICKNNVLKQVSKFRDDYKECDEWLPEYIEYREKKKEIVEPSSKKSKKPNRDNKSKPVDKRKKQPQHDKQQFKNTKRKEFSKPSETIVDDEDSETLHPSWASKRKQKELLKAALTGATEGPKRIKFADD